MEITRDLGVLALASRLRRLGDRLASEASRVYETEGVDFKARWFTLAWALRGSPARSISELARDLDVSHTAVHQVAAEMDRAGLIDWRRDPADARKRLIELGDLGRRVVADLEPLWADLRTATHDLLRESGCDLPEGLSAVDEALEERPLHRRVRDVRRRDDVEILDFRPELAVRFRELNLEWLESGFTVGPEDRKVLDDPAGEVIGPGGVVLFASVSGSVVGTVALLRHDASVWELAKMAVTRSERGRGVGRRLGRAALDRAHGVGARRLFLLTSPRLEPALRLYRSLGFREVDAPPVPHAGFARCSVAMEVELPPGRQAANP